jgi:hypothetical protein
LKASPFARQRGLAVVLSAILFFLASCTPANDAGKDVLHPDDLIHGGYVDTFTIEMNTLRIDSVQTYQLSRNLVGNYVDDQFGHIYAETYIQPRITGSSLTFGADVSKLTLDSLVLTLDLTDFYGRYNERIPLEIFEITEPFDTTLNSTSSLTVDPYDLANGYAIDFSGRTGFFDFIGIRLDDSLGWKLLRASPDKLVSNDSFVVFFKGLNIRSTDVSQSTSREPGGIFAFDPGGQKTFLKLYYHDSTAAKDYVFAINANSERFHSIRRTDETGRLFDLTANAQNDPYIQYGCIEAGALANLYVNIPFLHKLDPRIINRADLILKVDPAYLGSDNRYAPPQDIFMFLADSTKKATYNNTIINYPFTTYDPVHQEYAIDLTQAIQKLFTGNWPNNGFIIIPGQNGVTVNRAVLGGPGHLTLAPKLRVIYTTLPGQN